MSKKFKLDPEQREAKRLQAARWREANPERWRWIVNRSKQKAKQAKQTPRESPDLATEFGAVISEKC